MKGMEMEQPKMKTGGEPVQIGLDLQPMITNLKKPFELFDNQDISEFEVAIRENRVEPRLVQEYLEWQEEEGKQRRRDANPEKPFVPGLGQNAHKLWSLRNKNPGKK